MTLEEALELGRAWPDWQWALGQVARHRADHDDVVLVTAVATSNKDSHIWMDLRRIAGPLAGDVLHDRADRYVPDPRDPGFIGHALAQVEAALGVDVELHWRYEYTLTNGNVIVGFWHVRQVRCDETRTNGAFDYKSLGRGASKVEALLAARMAAP